MKFYYANPQPERFVDEVRAVAASGRLEKQPARVVIATFLGRVLAQNPGRIAAWLAQLSELAGGAREMLQMAAWLSQTAEARAWLAASGASPRALGPAPDLFAQPIDDPTVLDMLWAHYFATGDARAIRRIVSTLGLMRDIGAAARFEDSAQTDADRTRAINDGLFQAATWSLTTLSLEHPPLLAILEQLVERDELAADKRLALAIALQRIAPDRWQVDIDKAVGSAQVTRKR